MGETGAPATPRTLPQGVYLPGHVPAPGRGPPRSPDAARPGSGQSPAPAPRGLSRPSAQFCPPGLGTGAWAGCGPATSDGHWLLPRPGAAPHPGQHGPTSLPGPPPPPLQRAAASRAGSGGGGLPTRAVLAARRSRLELSAPDGVPPIPPAAAPRDANQRQRDERLTRAAPKIHPDAPAAAGPSAHPTRADGTCWLGVRLSPHVAGPAPGLGLGLPTRIRPSVHGAARAAGPRDPALATPQLAPHKPTPGLGGFCNPKLGIPRKRHSPERGRGPGGPGGALRPPPGPGHPVLPPPTAHGAEPRSQATPRWDCRWGRRPGRPRRGQPWGPGGPGRGSGTHRPLSSVSRTLPPARRSLGDPQQRQLQPGPWPASE